MEKVFLHFKNKHVQEVMDKANDIAPDILLDSIIGMAKAVQHIRREMEKKDSCSTKDFSIFIAHFYTFYHLTKELRETIMGIPSIEDEEEQRDIISMYKDGSDNFEKFSVNLGD